HGVVSSYEDRCAKSGDVELDRLGVEDGEKRVALAVDFAIRNPGVFEQPGDAASARAVERIDHEAPSGGADALEADHALEPLEVRGDQVNRLDPGCAPS